MQLRLHGHRDERTEGDAAWNGFRRVPSIHRTLLQQGRDLASKFYSPSCARWCCCLAATHTHTAVLPPCTNKSSLSTYPSRPARWNGGQGGVSTHAAHTCQLPRLAARPKPIRSVVARSVVGRRGRLAALAAAPRLAPQELALLRLALIPVPLLALLLVEPSSQARGSSIMAVGLPDAHIHSRRAWLHACRQGPRCTYTPKHTRAPPPPGPGTATSTRGAGCACS